MPEERFASLSLMFDSDEITFESEPFTEEVEITGHPTAHLAVSLLPLDGSAPSELDLFLTIRHYDQLGNEGIVSNLLSQ